MERTNSCEPTRSPSGVSHTPRKASAQGELASPTAAIVKNSRTAAATASMRRNQASGLVSRCTDSWGRRAKSEPSCGASGMGRILGRWLRQSGVYRSLSPGRKGTGAQAALLGLNRRNLNAMRIAADTACNCQDIARTPPLWGSLLGLVLFRRTKRGQLRIRYPLRFLKGVPHLAKIFGGAKSGLQRVAQLDHQRVPGGLGLDNILAGEGFPQPSECVVVLIDRSLWQPP